MMKQTVEPQTIDAYIAGFPADVQRILQQIRAVVRAAAPEAEEAIKYRIPTLVWHGNLVHFAAFRQHIGFYPTSSGIEQFKDALSAYNTSRGTVQFPLGAPIPYGLIKKIVKFRVQQTRDRIAAQPPRQRPQRSGRRSPAKNLPQRQRRSRQS